MCGAHDLAGNVWEWCLTKWRSDYRGYETQADQRLEGDDARVLRGGAWSSGADYARCAYRIWSEPDDRDGNIGFRVVASPFFALNSEPSELCSGG
jgi:formylglycine-generating enzyme required for sulfatase activity